MKVYLEEKDMPKDCKTTCKNCPFRGDEGLGCEERRMLDKDFICPLQPLSDHDKQVRKEVVQEVRETLENLIFGGWLEIKDKTLKQILDQISTTEQV